MQGSAYVLWCNFYSLEKRNAQEIHLDSLKEIICKKEEEKMQVTYPISWITNVVKKVLMKKEFEDKRKLKNTFLTTKAYKNNCFGLKTYIRDNSRC